MGFTVEDMLIISRKKYKMELIAGMSGWANSISWLLMVENTTITKSFMGKELVVTTGLGFDTTKKIIDLIDILHKHHGAGLIVNTGYYIKEIPKEVIAYADECDLPLMTVPWEISMAEMIKDLTVRIFFQSQTDEQTSQAFIKALKHPQKQEAYRKDLEAYFDVDGVFQVAAFTTKNLDSMDTVDRRRIGYRLQIYLENISHNGHFFYYNGCFLLVFNAVSNESRDEIIDGFLKRAQMRMPTEKIFVGLGSAVMDLKNLHISYKRADYAVKYAMNNKIQTVNFDELGLNRILYAVSDDLLLEEMGNEVLRPLLDYDKKHDSQLLETLKMYLKYNGSIGKVAQQMYIHKNTIVYRMAKIREILNCDLEDGEERLGFYLAVLIAQKNDAAP
ncbi:PucR C-terminal helix-turn-helix domain-containing protein [Acetitomaculum ruminis DSM 5522]|uniref:PucR C-terminal helix-turn-helix domain-containing protein n=1 Tax=Acetitomaculum ruminis DSM 5522 TaxID=1120918 RepID=A0A1I0YUW4_9FIRM|nr:PucR family transcriptional regulator [Acetitomaculum ruminis]SFB17185.1 PucR C-terminal helix-turn-helix domain-containing protein [Acetitomaculum ruminis DSM 5522]